MAKYDNVFRDIIGPPLAVAGFTRKRRVWRKAYPPVTLIVQSLGDVAPLSPWELSVFNPDRPPSLTIEYLRSQHRLLPYFTVEYGICVGPKEPRDVTFAQLRSRWGRYLTEKEQPHTDWWVAVDEEGPILTHTGSLYERLTVEYLRQVLSDKVIPLLEKYSTVAAIESVFVESIDWETGAPLPLERTSHFDARLKELHQAVQAPTPEPDNRIVDEIYVEALDDEQEGDHLADFAISYGDELARYYTAEVDLSVAFVAGFPGVDRAAREDRELVLGWGRPDLPTLKRALTAWWAELLRREG